MAQADANTGKPTAVKKKLLFGSKDVIKIKAKIDIVVLTVQNLGSKLEGHELWVKWKRGSSSSSKGETKKHVIRKGEAFLEEALSFTTTLIQDAKTEKFESKKIEFKVKEQKEKKDHTVGKEVTVDLATIAKKGTHEMRSFPLEKGKKDSPTLIVSFATDWVKINGKKLVKSSGTTAAPGQKLETVRIDGEEYILSPEEASVAETTAGDLSDNDDEAMPQPSPRGAAPPSGTAATTTGAAPPSPRSSALPVIRARGDSSAQTPSEAAKTDTEDKVVSLTAKVTKYKEKYSKEKEKRKHERTEVELLRKEISNLNGGDAAQHVIQLQLELERLKQEQSAAKRQSKHGSKLLSEDQTSLLREVESLRAQLEKAKRGSVVTQPTDESIILARDLAAAHAEIEDLKKEKEMLRDKLVDQKKLVETSLAEKEMAKKEAADARTKNKTLQSQVDEQQERLNALTNAVANEKHTSLELEKLKAENKVLRMDRDSYRDKISEVERRARALPADGKITPITPDNNRFWMYAFIVLFVVNLVLIRYF